MCQSALVQAACVHMLHIGLDLALQVSQRQACGHTCRGNKSWAPATSAQKNGLFRYLQAPVDRKLDRAEAVLGALPW